MMNRFRTMIVVGAVLSFIGAGHAAAQATGTLSRGAAEALEQYLDLDCPVGEVQRLLSAVLRHRSETEPALLRLLRAGPSEDTLAQSTARAMERWDRRAKLLRRATALSLTPGQAFQLQRESQQDYLSRARARMIRVYREKAALALAHFGGPAARRGLVSVAGQSGDALQPFVRDLLSRGG